MPDEPMAWTEVEQIAGKLLKERRGIERIAEAAARARQAEADVARLGTEAGHLREQIEGLRAELATAQAQDAEARAALAAEADRRRVAAEAERRTADEALAALQGQQTALQRTIETTRQRWAQEQANAQRAVAQDRQRAAQETAVLRERLDAEIAALRARKTSIEEGLRSVIARATGG